MFRITLALSTGALALVGVAPALAGQNVWHLDPERSVVAFHVKHLVVSTVTGRFSGFTGSITASADDFSDAVVEGRVPLKSVRTGDDERDGDLLKPPFFNAAAHPEALFKSTRVTRVGPERWTMEGGLTLRGNTRPVRFTVRRETDSVTRTPAFVAEADIDRFDWELRWNRIIEGTGVVVDRMVRIELRAVMARVTPPRDAAIRFTAVLDSAARAAAVLPFDHRDRERWNRGPGRRPGLALGVMNSAQRGAMHTLLRSSLSDHGYLRALAVIDSERRWAGTEEGMGSEFYWLAIFGDPSAHGRWAWRLGGHHLSLHFTFDGDSLIAATPLFFGAHPYRLDVPGPTEGRVLHGARRDLALSVWSALTPAARGAATIRPPVQSGDSRFVSQMVAVTPFPQPSGVRIGELPPHAQTALAKLVDDFVGDVRDPAIRQALSTARLLDARFAMVLDPGGDSTFYYRIQSPHWLIEVEDGGNHLHSLLRAPSDFGGRAPQRDYFGVQPVPARRNK